MTVKRRFSVGALVVGWVALAGCQKADSVIVTNRCGTPIEADFNDVPAWGTRYKSLEDGEQRDVLQIPEGSNDVFVSVRTVGVEDDVPKVQVDPDQWVRAGNGDILLDIAASLCPG